jgi:hypothetical protein
MFSSRHRNILSTSLVSGSLAMLPLAVGGLLLAPQYAPNFVETEF